MHFGHGQRCCAGIDSGDHRTQGRHAFGQNSAAAAHIQYILTRQGHPGVDIIDPQFVDIVQRFLLAAFIPPDRRHGFELGKFRVINVGNVLICQFIFHLLSA